MRKHPHVFRCVPSPASWFWQLRPRPTPPSTHTQSLRTAARILCPLRPMAETPHLPYLGHVACPDNGLAALWLADQHGG